MFTLSKFFFLNPGKYLPYPEDFRKTKIGIWSMWKQLEELLETPGVITGLVLAPK